MVASLFVCGITEGCVPNRPEGGKRAGAFTQFHLSVVNSCDELMLVKWVIPVTPKKWVLTIKDPLESSGCPTTVSKLAHLYLSFIHRLFADLSKWKWNQDVPTVFFSCVFAASGPSLHVPHEDSLTDVWGVVFTVVKNLFHHFPFLLFLLCSFGPFTFTPPRFRISIKHTCGSLPRKEYPTIFLLTHTKWNQNCLLILHRSNSVYGSFFFLESYRRETQTKASNLLLSQLLSAAPLLLLPQFLRLCNCIVSRPAPNLNWTTGRTNFSYVHLIMCECTLFQDS